MTVLAIKQLVVEVWGEEILHGVDLVILSGKVHALMGPNGSGKSTLSHLLMGREGYVVKSGEVTLDGVDLLAMDTSQRAQAGLFLAMQQPIEVPGVTLEALLSEVLADSEVATAETGDGEATQTLRQIMYAEAMKVGLDPSLLDRSLNTEFSGGEYKRSECVGMGVIKPRLGIFDEIDTGLDIDSLKLVATRLKEATSAWGMGVLAITHYSRLLDVLTPDLVYVLLDGRIVDCGGPELVSAVEHSGYSKYGVDVNR